MSDDTHATTHGQVANRLHLVEAVHGFDIVISRIDQPRTQSVIAASDANGALEKALETDINHPSLMSWAAHAHDELVAVAFTPSAGSSDLDRAEIETLFPASLPRPAATWLTPAGGVSAVFARDSVATARELAGGWLLFAPQTALSRGDAYVGTGVRHPFVDGTKPRRVHQWRPATSLQWLAEALEHEHAASTDGPSLRDAARALVHLGHQQHVLRARHGVARELVQSIWALVLRHVNADRLSLGDDDSRQLWQSRIAAASSPELDIARTSSGVWVDTLTLMPRVATPSRTLAFLPSVFSPPMIDKAASTGALDGFRPLHPLAATEVIPPFVVPPRGSVFVPRRRDHDDPPAADLTLPSDGDLARAWSTLEAALPGINRGYLAALIVTMFVGQRGVGPWPIVCAVGQTGAAKTAHIHLAAGMVGVKAAPITLGGSDDTRRRIGLALESGARLLYVDEIGRVEGLGQKLEPLLAANTTVAFRAKYANERETFVRAGLVLLGSTLPRAIVASPEVARRAVGFRLLGADKRWTLPDQAGSPLDLRHCRKVESIRGALDTITAHVWRRVAEIGPAGDWRRMLIDDFHAVDVSELDLVIDEGARAAAIVGLYDLFRLARPDQLSAEHGWSGWLSATPGTKALELLGVFCDPSASAAVLAEHAADLDRLNLAPILGVAKPELQLLVRRRARRTLIKFVQPGTLKGTGFRREELPPPRT